MKFSHAWLEDYVTIAEDPDRVAQRLTAAGLTVDAVERGAAGKGAEEVLYDIDIFTNRPDCMNHIGVAREYAALSGSALRHPVTPPLAGGPPTAQSATVAIEDPALCRRYSARCVLGLRVGPSPEWLRRRLESIGQRPINNVVDATNFVLWEIGHPLHPFDLDRLSERRVVVRLARSGETMTTLDGIERALTPKMLVIADARVPVALAGIMGGRASEIADGTRNVLLESAWFDPVSVRRTARALGLRTEASHRFERGADPEATLQALDRAASIIAEAAGGTVTDPPIDLYPGRQPARVVSFRPARAGALLGAPIEEPAMRGALTRLSFAVADGEPGAWRVTVPAFRDDVRREADLIEEVARHQGYDGIPGRLPLLPDDGGGRTLEERRIAAARRGLLAAGLSEAINYAMIDREDCLLFDEEGGQPVAIENPLQAQASFLRPSLLPGLLRNVSHNLNHGVSGCHLFEVGTVFRRATPVPGERRLLAWLLTGRGLPVHWSLPRREVDVHDARGTAEVLGEVLGLPPLTFSSDRITFLAAGSALRVAVGGHVLGVAGEIAFPVLQRYGIDRPVFGGEVDLDALLLEPHGGRRYSPLPRYPAARRDLALVVDRSVRFEAIERVVRAAGPVPIAAVAVFDRYQGAGLPPGHAGLAIQVVFQHPERTLEADEVQRAQDSIVAALGAKLGARLRGAQQE